MPPQHRLHHRDPDIRFVLMPLPIMVLAWPWQGSWLLRRRGLGDRDGGDRLSRPTTSDHFLTAPAIARRVAHKRQWRFHRLHHFQNSTTDGRDSARAILLKTFPDDVDTSKTARTLGFEDGLGES
jgi:hypothetical protein